MENSIGTSLLITAIGMGLVFVAILFLWALMEVVVRLTAEKVSAKDNSVKSAADEPLEGLAAETTHLKAQAAAAAVAVVMSIQGKSAALRASRPVRGVSVWQSAMRTARLSQRNSVYNRKPRGNRS